MINKKEIPIGSIIRVNVNDLYTAVCEVVEPYSEECLVRILRVADQGEKEGFGAGTEHKFSYKACSGLMLFEANLRSIGFIESDERAWRLMYYFGDMRLYWKYDKRKCYSTFKFRPDFTRKAWTRIECAFIHSLQNIMRFLTGGELEFTWIEAKEEKGGVS